MKVKFILSTLLVLSNISWFIVYRSKNAAFDTTSKYNDRLSQELKTCTDAKVKFFESLADCQTEPRKQSITTSLCQFMR